jgi:hypothetical protein
LGSGVTDVGDLFRSLLSSWLADGSTTFVDLGTLRRSHRSWLSSSWSLGRELWSRTDFPLGLSLGSCLASSSCDVDKVLVEEYIKGDVRHWDGFLLDGIVQREDIKMQKNIDDLVLS